MSLILVIVGAFILLIGAIVLIAPGKMRQMLSALVEKDRFLIAAVFRIVVGVLFLIAAQSTRAPMFVTVVGVIMIMRGVMIPLLGKARLKALVAWFLLKGNSVIRVWGIMAAAFGAALVWAGA